MAISTTSGKNFYQANGYLTISGLYDVQEIDKLNSALRAHADQNFSAIMNPDRLEFLTAATPSGSHVVLQDTANLVGSYMRDPRIVEWLEILQGREVVGLMSQMLFKETGSIYANQAWNPHQDNSYPRNQNNQYITTNLFLESANVENGTLYAFPGTHLEGLLPSEDVVSYRENPGSNPGRTVLVPSKYEKVDLEFQKGDMLILHGDLIHGSHPNQSSRSRPMLSMSYISEGESFIPGETAKRRVIKLH